MGIRFGDLRDFVCRECGLYGMVDVVGKEFEYDSETGVLFDVIDDSDGRHRGDRIVCDCGGEYFEMHPSGKNKGKLTLRIFQEAVLDL